MKGSEFIYCTFGTNQSASFLYSLLQDIFYVYVIMYVTMQLYIPSDGKQRELQSQAILTVVPSERAELE
jgi:hypothetical protein